MGQRGGHQDSQHQICRDGGDAHTHNQGNQHSQDEQDQRLSAGNVNQRGGKPVANAGPHHNTADDTRHSAGYRHRNGGFCRVYADFYQLLRGQAAFFIQHDDNQSQQDGIQPGAGHGLTCHRQDINQEYQGQKQVKTAQQRPDFGHILLLDALQAVLLGINVHGEQQRGIVQDGRNGGGLDQIKVRNRQTLRNQESRGSHDRRGKLSAGRGCGLHRRGSLRLVAGLFHQGDGKGACADHISHGAAADGAEKAAGNDRHLGGSAPVFSKHGGGYIRDVVPYPADLHQGAQGYKEDDIEGRRVQCRAKNAVRGQIGQIDKILKGQPGMLQKSGPEWAGKAKKDKYRYHNDQGLPHGAAGGVQDG